MFIDMLVRRFGVSRKVADIVSFGYGASFDLEQVYEECILFGGAVVPMLTLIHMRCVISQEMVGGAPGHYYWK